MQIVVAGQGYVGLPLAVRAAEAGHRVVGYRTAAPEGAGSGIRACPPAPGEQAGHRHPETERPAVTHPTTSSHRLELPTLTEQLATVIEERAILTVTGPDPAATAGVLETALDQLPAAAPRVLRVAPDVPADRAAVVRALYTTLHLARVAPQPRRLADAEDRIVAELRRAPRLVVLPAAHHLRTPALQMLYTMWAHLVPGRFVLVLAGDDRLARVLDRPALASLKSCVLIRHRLN